MEAYRGILPHRYRNCFASIDGKRFEICRPSGQNNQQAAVYNDYYGSHNLGFQCVTGPNGMYLQFSGPYAGAGNDLEMLALSQTLPSIRESLIDINTQDMDMDVLADKIYPQIHANGIASLRRNHRNLIDQEIEEDTAAASVRVGVEQSFAKIVNHFPFVDFKKGLKINEREIGKYIVVAAILVNLHTCLYGSQLCTHFSINNHFIYPPTLEDYMMV